MMSVSRPQRSTIPSSDLMPGGSLALKLMDMPKSGVVSFLQKSCSGVT